MNTELDETDRRILRSLQADGRLTVRQLAAQVHLSPTPVYERLRRLEQGGYIRGYHAVLDSKRLGMGFTVYCNIKLSRLSTDIHQEFGELVETIPEVSECYNVSGSWDYMLRVNVPDMQAYRALVIDTLGRFPHLASLESVFVMDEVKNTFGVKV